jgi:hypothetical protein
MIGDMAMPAPPNHGDRPERKIRNADPAALAALATVKDTTPRCPVGVSLVAHKLKAVPLALVRTLCAEHATNFGPIAGGLAVQCSRPRRIAEEIVNTGLHFPLAPALRNRFGIVLRPIIAVPAQTIAPAMMPSA